MRQDPALCKHDEIRKRVTVETINVPELGIEQLVLRIKVWCRACREPFVIKTMRDGFSTDEIGLVGSELFVPLEQPYLEETDASDEEQLTSGRPESDPRPPKEQLH